MLGGENSILCRPSSISKHCASQSPRLLGIDFILPKKVIDGVIATCRNYLWDGKASSSKTPLIAWDLICRDKKEGGLGFKESHAWNVALLGKYIWSVATKADNLWVKWVNHVD